jgi:hypothetical protein
MTTQTDVKASAALAATATFKNAGGAAIGRCRIKGLYAAGGAGAGSITITDGSSTGPTLIKLDVPINGTPYLLLPGEGILSELGPFGTVTAIGSATIIYG